MSNERKKERQTHTYTHTHTKRERGGARERRREGIVWVVSEDRTCTDQEKSSACILSLES